MSYETSLGVTQAILTSYLKCFAAQSTDAANFFSKEGTLYWENEQIKGKLNIYDFFKSKKIIFQPSSVDTQFVQIMPQISMLNISGVAIFIGENYSQHFSSTFYIKTIHNGTDAIILMQHIHFE